MKNRCSVLLIVLLLGFPSYAMAYLDPATGSMALQIAVGGLLAGLAVVKMYWRKIRSFFGNEKDGEA